MNRLATESSPYLRQHAGNPVDWFPWGEEAFSRARKEDKPILLSVGYSSCHWCHVMAHESFEDEATAELMNELFVNVKVDREERPDVDAVYMEATQALTGRGGWPMTVFLTPEGLPFFAGTYFPKKARGGLPGFSDLLRSVATAWSSQREEVLSQAETLTGLIERSSHLSPSGQDEAGLRSTDRDSDAGSAGGDLAAISREATAALRGWMSRLWDPGWGGFGHAPKFPQASVVEMALRIAHDDPADDEALAIATTSLAGMAAGGIYDHLGGGFARYSTDERWLVPHFEKMLYDQASLVRAYLHGWQVTGDARWLQVVRETVAYVLRDLAVPGGGLASAEDADSPDPSAGGGGREGAFYLFRAREIRELLPEGPADALMDFYRVTWKGNLTGRMEGGEGLNILHRPPGATLERPAEVEEARRLLFLGRENRPRPGLDTKVLTEWNAMFLSSLAEAAATTGDAGWAEAAESLGSFLYTSLRRDDGRWMRSFQDGRALHLAYAADYAWIVESFTRLSELTGRAVWLERAREAARSLLELFGDPEEGGFFTAGSDADRLIVRHKEAYDGSTPSASAASAVALWRLGSLTGDGELVEAAEATLRAFGDRPVSQPAASAFAVSALDVCARGAIEVVVTGDRPDLVSAARRPFLPSMVLAWGEPFSGPLWEGRTEAGAAGVAYVCEGYACRAPIDDPDELDRVLTSRS